MYQYLEDNGGGLYLFVVEDGQVLAGIGDLEYAERGEWWSIREGLGTDPMAEIDGWDGHLDDPQDVYDTLKQQPLGYRVVCEDGEVYPDDMGKAASLYFEEPRDRGRPPIHGEPMKLVSVHLKQDQIDWLKNQEDGMSETIRSLVESKIDRDEQMKYLWNVVYYLSSTGDATLEDYDGDVDYMAQDLVRHWYTNEDPEHPIPSWIDNYDLDWLIDRVAKALA